MIDALELRLDLYGRILEARAAWLRVEQLAETVTDTEFILRVDIARGAILDARDRLDTILEEATA